MTATPETADQFVALAIENDDLPRGFRFGAVVAGIKPSGRPDVSLIVGDGPLVAAGVYTTNAIVAAPVSWCKRLTPAATIRAVATVSGNANACTGERGEDDCRSIAAITAEHVGCDPEQVLVMSTGIIGRFLPMEKVRSGIAAAHADLDAGAAAFTRVSEAIRTTDQDRKIAFGSVALSGGTVRVAAMAKGAGMIAPNMATLLAMIVTDAALSPTDAHDVLRRVADASLNRITVDGHASTNDTLLMLAPQSDSQAISGNDLELFENKVTELAIDLGKQIVADGEGATHYMSLTVNGAVDDAAAMRIARHTAQSLLVKTALTGNDPNWGRIVSAAGAAGESIEAAKVSLSICGIEIYRRGTPLEFDAAVVSAAMGSAVEVPVMLDVGDGSGMATIWASDLTKAYVSFNSEYTT